jgi:MerR family transcriptional regulator/heat shock protein HspR
METVAPFRIAEASRRAGLHPRTLMLYERLGLLVPQRRGQQRRYTEDDLRWLGCIREINHEGGVSLAGIRAFMNYLPCWALRGCARRTRLDVSPGKFDCARAAAAVERLFDGQAPEACKDCGHYQPVEAPGARRLAVEGH